MNLRDRGITVGDLLIILIIILSTSFIIKKYNHKNQSSLSNVNTEIISLQIS